MPVIKLKRAYEKPSGKDAERILVGRSWPRGVTKQAVRVDPSRRGIPPSELRQWIAHDADKWAAFCERYSFRRKGKDWSDRSLKRKAKAMRITFVYSARAS